jgi:putative intracellular protease/amidase
MDSGDHPAPRARTYVDILVFEGFALREVAVVFEIFDKANALAASIPDSDRPYKVTLLSARGGSVASSSSVLVWTQRLDSLQRDRENKLLFIAGGAGAREASEDQDTVDWLGVQRSTSGMVLGIGDRRSLLEAADLPRTRTFHLGDDASLRQKHAPVTQTTDAILAALRIVELDLQARVNIALDFL